MRYVSTKIIPMGSTAFRQWKATSHCRLLHGYRLQCKIWFTADELDGSNWVFDFGACKNIKSLLEKQFDHTTLVAADDPELETFKLLESKGMIDLRIADKGVGIERTAEWVYNTVSKYVKDTTNGRVRILKVEVWEHEGNSAIYEEVDKQEYMHAGEVDMQTVVIDSTGIDNNVVEASIEDIDTTTTTKLLPPLYSKVTTGMSNPFEGTSWGD